MRGSQWLGRGGLLLAMAFGGVACNELLGIEEASVDPRLDDDAGAGQSSGKGGSAGSASGSSGSSGTRGGSGGNTAGTGASGAPGSENGGESGATMEPPGTGGGAGDMTTGGAGEVGTGASGGSGGSGGSSGTAGTGGSSGSSVVSEGGAAGEAPTVSICDTYCNEIMSYCVGSLQQYVDEKQCERVCEMLPQGTLGDATGNTVACRLKSAADARYASGVERGRYCRRAGPGGDGGCGTNCEGFCSLMQNVCTAEESPLYRFASTAECMTACEALPDGDVPYTTSDESVSDGNSVQCRLFHVNSAAMLDPLEHCEHAMGITLCESSEASEHEH